MPGHRGTPCRGLSLEGQQPPVRDKPHRGCSAYLGLCRCCCRAHLLPGHYGSSLPARCLHCCGSQTPSWDGQAPWKALWDTMERGCLAGKEAMGPDLKGPTSSPTHCCYLSDNGPAPCSQWQKPHGTLAPHPVLLAAFLLESLLTLQMRACPPGWKS